jgi:hypothetical protein
MLSHRRVKTLDLILRKVVENMGEYEKSHACELLRKENLDAPYFVLYRKMSAAGEDQKKDICTKEIVNGWKKVAEWSLTVSSFFYGFRKSLNYFLIQILKL